MSKYLTKKQTIGIFRKMIIPSIRQKEKFYFDGKIDGALRREEWSYFVSNLQTDGIISEKQYENWTNPF